MKFDVADAKSFYDQGLWDDIVTHEMMHVLGFGSLWTYGSHDLVDGNVYKGEAAMGVYGGPIPVETDYGPGTAGSHWDEETFGNELMTGFINTDDNLLTNTDNYLSKFSVMSLDDLGYNVVYQ